MEPVGDQFLARAPLTGKDHRPVQSGGPGNMVQGLEEERRLADDRTFRHGG